MFGIDDAAIIALAPAIGSFFGGLFGRKKQTDAQQQNLDQQNQLAQYQLNRLHQIDPVQDALMRMAMGMLPTASQPDFAGLLGFQRDQPPQARARTASDLMAAPARRRQYNSSTGNYE